MITAKCPECGWLHELEDRMGGRNASCDCGARFLIPALEAKVLGPEILLKTPKTGAEPPVPAPLLKRIASKESQSEVKQTLLSPVVPKSSESETMSSPVEKLSKIYESVKKLSLVEPILKRANTAALLPSISKRTYTAPLLVKIINAFGRISLALGAVMIVVFILAGLVLMLRSGNVGIILLMMPLLLSALGLLIGAFWWFCLAALIDYLARIEFNTRK